MSCEGLPKQFKQRFKGVENFLRRVAFNLGNSPSQTEVKIISCIPIDVTDLQQKIINLEKELDLVRGCPAKTTVQQALLRRIRSSLSNACDPPRARVDLRDCPALTFCDAEPPPPPPAPCQQPPIVFNECTCWPSDISDVCRESTEPIELIEPSLCTESKKGFFKRSKKKKKKQVSCSCNTPLVYFTQTENSPFASCHKSSINSRAPKPNKESIGRTFISEMVHKQYTAAPIPEEYSISSQFSSPVCRDVSPARASAPTRGPGLLRDPGLPRAPGPLRDPGPLRAHGPLRASAQSRAPDPYGSDMCSCCQGPFHNTDFHTTDEHHTYINNYPLPSSSYNSYVNTTDFYDTSLYDMVPVKEKPIIPPSFYYETPKRKQLKNYMDASHFPERDRQKYRYHPFVVNYSKVPAYPYKKSLKLVNKKEKYRRDIPKREVITRKVDRYCEEGSLRSCSIDCGRVYIKKLHPSVKSPSAGQSVGPVVSVTYKNAECLTTSFYDTECQTTPTQSNYAQIGSDLNEDKKTEETLNQIKDILQSVLTEVKTNTQVKNKPEHKPTKDAVVQKGLSQDAMPGGSSMLNSYNYNINPFNMASCSRQINPGACCYPNFPYASGKCLQNFPVFIQTPGRNICSSCYHNSSHVTKSVNPRLPSNTAVATAVATTAAITAATNTDVARKERSKETEKLIKEIYKSIAVNMEVPTKDTSASEYGGAKSTPRRSLNKIRSSFQDESVRVSIKSQSNTTSTNTPKVKKSITPLSTLNCKLISNTKSLQSQTLSRTDTDRCIRINRMQSYLDNLEALKSRQNRIEEEYEAPTAISSEEDSNSEYESELTPRKHSKKKPNLFSKMFKKSVKLFSAKTKNERTNKREEQVQVQSEEEEKEELSEAESDDYQTVYSHRATAPRHRAPRGHSHKRGRQHDRRSPYLEQEYRRQWNEKLMFKDNHRDSSETVRSRDTDPRQRARPSYYRDYEARSALVQNNQRNTLSNFAPLRAFRRTTGPTVNVASKGLSWLKKHKPSCGEQWKKFIMES